MIYIVTRKSDGVEVFRYDAAQPTEWNGMEFATHDHTPEVTENTDGSIDAPILYMSWTQTQWKRRFTQEERVNIREAAKNNSTLADYMDLMNGAEEIRNNDPDVIQALALLEQVGLIAAGRAQEILNGN